MSLRGVYAKTGGKQDELNLFIELFVPKSRDKPKDNRSRARAQVPAQDWASRVTL